MKFGTIGAGTVAFAFAREAVATGHEVVLSSRRSWFVYPGPEAGSSTQGPEAGTEDLAPPQPLAISVFLPYQVPNSPRNGFAAASVHCAYIEPRQSRQTH